MLTIISNLESIIPNLYVARSRFDGQNILEHNGNVAWVIPNTHSIVNLSNGVSTQQDDIYEVIIGVKVSLHGNISQEVDDAYANLQDWSQKLLELEYATTELKYNESVANQMILVTVQTKIRG